MGSLLDKLQRTTAVCCTEAFSKTRGAAPDALLHVPSLCVFIRGEALKATCRLKRSGCWSNTEWGEAEIASGRDLRTCVFNACTEHRITHNRIFTDGSKTDSGSESEVFVGVNGDKIHFSLGKYASVFQAAVFAIPQGHGLRGGK